MKEGDLVPAQATSRGLVDEVHPGAAQLVEGGLNVRYLKGHMVQTFATSLQEAADGAFGVERLDELDLPASHAQRGGLDALVRQYLAHLERHAELFDVEGECGVDIAHDIGHMVDLLEMHARPTLSPPRAFAATPDG